MIKLFNVFLSLFSPFNELCIILQQHRCRIHVIFEITKYLTHMCSIIKRFLYSPKRLTNVCYSIVTSFGAKYFLFESQKFRRCSLMSEIWLLGVFRCVLSSQQSWWWWLLSLSFLLYVRYFIPIGKTGSYFPFTFNTEYALTHT